MKKNDNIIGCFVSGPTINYDASQRDEEIADEQGALFRNYIWGVNGICNLLKKLKYKDYGNDLKLILLQFYLKPHPIELKNIHEIENYRKREKAIGISIIVTDDNFFNLKDKDRKNFLIKSIFHKLDLMKQVILKENLDTKLDFLKHDLDKILKRWNNM